MVAKQKIILTNYSQTHIERFCNSYEKVCKYPISRILFMMIIYLSGINLALGGGYHAIMYCYNTRQSLTLPFHPYLLRGGITFCCPFIRKITPSQLTLAPISKYSRPTQSPDFPPLPSSKSNHLGILAPLIILFFSLFLNNDNWNHYSSNYR